MKNKIRDTPELQVPKGYEFGDIYETDDTGYGFDKPMVEEEVKISFGGRSEEDNA